MIGLTDVFISPSEDMYAFCRKIHAAPRDANGYSYFVTELLGSDLHRILGSGPLQNQFVQYFVYQILVSLPRSFLLIH